MFIILLYVTHLLFIRNFTLGHLIFLLASANVSLKKVYIENKWYLLFIYVLFFKWLLVLICVFVIICCGALVSGGFLNPIVKNDYEHMYLDLTQYKYSLLIIKCNKKYPTLVTLT